MRNTRDVGGLRTADGHTMKYRKLIRGEKLDRLSRADLSALQEFKPTHILDLRTDQEVAERPDREVPGTIYVHLPIFDEQTSGITHEKDPHLRDKVKAIPDLNVLYREMVTRHEYVANLKKILRFVVDTLVTDPDACIYYHCTAGKDRTGVLTYLLLSMCGVPFETILEDYLLSNKHKDPTIPLKIAAVTLLLWDPQVTWGLHKTFAARASYLESARTGIEETYGDMEKFLTEVMGISPAEQEEFRETVTE